MCAWPACPAAPHPPCASLPPLLPNNQQDKMTVARARKIQRFLSQPFAVAEVFTGTPGAAPHWLLLLNGLSAVVEWVGLCA